MTCPECNYPCDRDEVDIGVGTQYGPWRCNGCGWSEEDDIDTPIYEEPILDPPSTID